MYIKRHTYKVEYFVEDGTLFHDNMCNGLEKELFNLINLIEYYKNIC